MMKKTAFLVSVLTFFVLIALAPLAVSHDTWKLGPTYGGRVFQTPSDPDYVAYEREAKTILLKEIKDRYGVKLNGDLVSADQLLEIEALLKFKRSTESVEEVLEKFPGVLL
jgi:hypothetical protein